MVVTLGACAELPEAVPLPSSRVDQGLRPFNDPDSEALRWVERHQDDPRARALGQRLGFDRDPVFVAAVPLVMGDEDVVSRVGEVVLGARRVDRIATFVLRAGASAVDRCGGSVVDGGAVAREIAETLGERPSVFVVVSQAVDQLACGASSARVREAQEADREVLEALAVARGDGVGAGVAVVVGVGPVVGLELPEVAEVLTGVGVGDLDGVAVDVGGYATAAVKEEWALELRERVARPGADAFVTAWDSGRIGENESTAIDACNAADAFAADVFSPAPPGRPQRLWLSPPGISDGECGIAPTTPAGEFSPALAWSMLGLDEDDLEQE